jgi:hypothetical protein
VSTVVGIGIEEVLPNFAQVAKHYAVQVRLRPPYRPRVGGRAAPSARSDRLGVGVNAGNNATVDVPRLRDPHRMYLSNDISEVAAGSTVRPHLLNAGLLAFSFRGDRRVDVSPSLLSAWDCPPPRHLPSSSPADGPSYGVEANCGVDRDSRAVAYALDGFESFVRHETLP